MTPEDLLHKLCKGFGGLPADRFESRFTEDVGELEDETCVGVLHQRLPKLGNCSLFLLKGGLCVLEDGKGLWSLYETRERSEEKEYYARWNEFVRGCWRSEVPQIEGTFPVRDREGRRGHDRTLKRVQGRLVDVTRKGGFVGHGKISEFLGDWWSSPYPPLRGAL